MKVGIVVGGRFLGFDVAAELQRRGMLAGIVTHYARAPREGIHRSLLRWNPWVEAGQRWDRWRGKEGSEVDVRRAAQFGRWAARRLPACDVLQGWTGYTLESIPVARARGTVVVATRASAHIRAQAALLADEYAAFGLTAPAVSPRMIERECEEYERADYVQVFSTFALRTFLAEGVAPERLVLVPAGVELGDAPVARTPAGGPLRVLFLGNVTLQKGVHYLLQAVRRLGPGAARLTLHGGLSAEGEMILRRFGGEWKGYLRGDELRRAFAEHDVLVLPSVQDGFGSVICEAMAAGLPVVASAHTSGPDLIDEGVTGFVVPPRDVDALVTALGTLAEDRARCRRMGTAAAAAIRARGGWKEAVDAMLATYEGLRCAS